MLALNRALYGIPSKEYFNAAVLRLLLCQLRLQDQGDFGNLWSKFLLVKNCINDERKLHVDNLFPNGNMNCYKSGNEAEFLLILR